MRVRNAHRFRLWCLVWLAMKVRQDKWLTWRLWTGAVNDEHLKRQTDEQPESNLKAHTISVIENTRGVIEFAMLWLIWARS